MTNPRIPFQLANERRPLPLPASGKRLIVHCVINVEYWPFDKPMPRKALTVPHGNNPIPDIPNYCWAEYGLRCGLPRLLNLLSRVDVPKSVNLNASVITHYPKVVIALLEAQCEFVGHGYLQRLLHNEEDEEETITRSLNAISEFTGKKVRGWMSPGFAQTFHTPDILTKLGVEYNLDWVLDDLPCWMHTKHGPLVGVPYAFELNDSLVYTVEKQSSNDILQRVKDTLQTFENESLPRVLTLGLHPHQIGVPHRIGYLAQALELLKKRTDTIFMTGSEIADWYANAEPYVASV